jgi:hypothetical protein
MKLRPAPVGTDLNVLVVSQGEWERKMDCSERSGTGIERLFGAEKRDEGRKIVAELGQKVSEFDLKHGLTCSISYI